MVRVKGFARPKNTKSDMNKLTHGSADDLHFVFAVAGKAITKGPDDRVMSFGDDRRKEERFSHSGVTGL